MAGGYASWSENSGRGDGPPRSPLAAEGPDARIRVRSLSEACRSRIDLIFRMVAGPAADCLLRRPNVSLVVASNDRAESGALVEGNERARAVDLDISDGPRLRALVDEADVVIR